MSWRERIGGGLAVASGIGLVAIIALTDVAIGGSHVLIPLLIAGPLTAATGGTPHATAGVAVLALAVALPLGPLDDAFLSTDHTIEVLSVALGGTLAVVAAAARARSDEAVAATGALLALERGERARSEFLGRASRLLEAPPEPQAMLERIVALAVPDLAELCVVDLIGEDGTLRLAALHGADPDQAEAVRTARAHVALPLDSPHPIAVAARTETPQLLRELPREPRPEWATDDAHLQALRRLRYATAIAVPLLARGRTLGVLLFARFTEGQPYDEADLGMGIEIGRRAAIALDNASLFSDLSRTERQLEAVLENLGEAVTVQAPDRPGLVYANQAAADLLESDGPAELLATPVEELIDRFVILDERGQPFDLSGLPGRQVLAGDPLPRPALMRMISKAAGDERWMLAKASAVHDADGSLALAVNIIEDVTEAHRAERQQRFLSAASKLLSSSLEIEITVDKVAWTIVPELADWCVVDLPDERGVLRRRAIAADVDHRDQLEPVLTGPALERDAPGTPIDVLRTGRSVVARGAAEVAAVWGSDEPRAQALMRETHALIRVPMTAGNRVLGVITLATAHSRRSLGDTEVALVEELGRRAGVAVENARVHEARTQIATTLQRSLLPPRLPSIPGISIAARFRAAVETSNVGGDFYDIFAVDSSWMVIVGDVTGKGPVAATTTSLARYTMRTAATYERSPAAVLARLNAALAVEPDRRQLCTVVCARIELDLDGAIVATIASGGHPPAYVLRGDRAEPVTASGPLLGAFEDGSWQEQRLRLRPGESLVLYTDGVTDTRGAHERFGGERLEALLGAVAGLEADEIASRIDNALVAFERGAQRDDVALLVLRTVTDDRSSATPPGPAPTASRLA